MPWAFPLSLPYSKIGDAVAIQIVVQMDTTQKASVITVQLHWGFGAEGRAPWQIDIRIENE